MQWDDTRQRWVDNVRQPRERRAESGYTSSSMLLDPLSEEALALARRNARLLFEQTDSVVKVANLMALPVSRVQELLDATEPKSKRGNTG